MWTTVQQTRVKSWGRPDYPMCVLYLQAAIAREGHDDRLREPESFPEMR
jgi:hypothetical protein